jgi:hypothetical protein
MFEPKKHCLNGKNNVLRDRSQLQTPKWQEKSPVVPWEGRRAGYTAWRVQGGQKAGGMVVDFQPSRG